MSNYTSDMNMYGCLPCPECGERYRCVRVDDPKIIKCDDCGFDEPITKKNYGLYDERIRNIKLHADGKKFPTRKV